MGVKKSKSKKSNKSGSIASKVKGVASAIGAKISGGSSSRSGGHRRGHGPAYYARKLATLKLKRKYQRQLLKF